jgi:hypothetical protein
MLFNLTNSNKLTTNGKETAKRERNKEKIITHYYLSENFLNTISITVNI